MKRDLSKLIDQALATTTKTGKKIFDQDNLEVNVAGTFAKDKFIVIRQKEEREESNPDTTLRAHHQDS